MDKVVKLGKGVSGWSLRWSLDTPKGFGYDISDLMRRVPMKVSINDGKICNQTLTRTLRLERFGDVIVVLLRAARIDNGLELVCVDL